MAVTSDAGAVDHRRLRIRAWLLWIVPGAWASVLGRYLFAPAAGNDRPTVNFSAADLGNTHVPLRSIARGFVLADGRLWPVAAVLVVGLVASALLPADRPVGPLASLPASVARWAPEIVGVLYAAYLWTPQVRDRGTTVAAVLPVALVSWFALQRPWLRYVHRTMHWFVGGLWAISLASLFGRLWAIGTATADNPGNGDPFYYHAQANMLADRVGFGEPIQWITEHRFVATAIHPPLFTLWLTPSSLLGARGFLSHKAMAAFAGVAVVVVAGLLGRRLAGPRAGLLAAGLVALAPDLWIVDGTLWPEGLYTALVGLALLAAYWWLERPSLRRAAWVGAAVGGAVLTRGEAIFLLPLLCLPLAFSLRRSVARWGAHVGVMTAVALALLAPWTIRNLVTFDHVVPVSTNSEEVLYYANCPDVYSGQFIGYWSFNCQQQARKARVAKGLPADPPGDESARAAGWGKLGRQYAMDHKDRWPAVALARVTGVWDLQHADNTARALVLEGRPYLWSSRGLRFYRLTLIPALAGLVILIRRSRAARSRSDDADHDDAADEDAHAVGESDGHPPTPAWPLMMMLAMVTITALSVYGHIRFRTVGDFVLLVAAGVAIDAAIAAVAARRTAPRPA